MFIFSWQFWLSVIYFCSEWILLNIIVLHVLDSLSPCHLIIQKVFVRDMLLSVLVAVEKFSRNVISDLNWGFIKTALPGGPRWLYLVMSTKHYSAPRQLKLDSWTLHAGVLLKCLYVQVLAAPKLCKTLDNFMLFTVTLPKYWLFTHTRRHININVGRKLCLQWDMNSQVWSCYNVWYIPVVTWNSIRFMCW